MSRRNVRGYRMSYEVEDESLALGETASARGRLDHLVGATLNEGFIANAIMVLVRRQKSRVHFSMKGAGMHAYE